MTILDWLLSFMKKPFAKQIGVAGTKDWSFNLPPWTSQYSVQTRTDAMDCLSEALINIVYMKTGFDASPRALAKLSNTTLAGNTVDAVLAAANKYGLIPYELWPTPSQFDWGTYYADIPQEILDQAIKCKITRTAPNLDQTPLWTQLAWGLNLSQPTRHMVAQINQTQYFDSEQGAEVKDLTYNGATVEYQTSLNIQLMIETKTVRFADNKTLGIMINTPNGVQIIKATSEEQWRSWNKPDSYGKPTVNPDSTTNWGFELQLNF